MVETPTEQEALDAYSVIVSSVAETVLPSVASLRIGRGGRGFGGAGSGVVITPDGFLVTSAHVVAAGSAASASFLDGTEYDVEDRKSTRLNSSHSSISYAVFCLK